MLAGEGHDVELFDGKVYSHRQNAFGQWVTDVPDVVVIQRPMGRTTAEEVIPLCQSHGVAVVVEIDDDFRALDTANVAFHNTHVRRSADYNSNWLARSCARADLVTCTTPAIARRYAAHGRSAIIPNYIPAAWEAIPQPRYGVPRVGWAGHLSTHPRDLEPIGHRLDATLAAGRGIFRAIGDARVQRVLRIPDSRWECTEWVPIERYPFEVCALDIGLVPLVDTAFNHAKSALKATEYAALGVVPIMSPTPDNRRLRTELGIGVLARDSAEWALGVADLLRDPARRHDLAAAGRESVYHHATIEQNAWRYLEAWETAIKNRKRATPHLKGAHNEGSKASGVRPGREAPALSAGHGTG